jgi:hypothetical protein
MNFIDGFEKLDGLVLVWPDFGTFNFKKRDTFDGLMNKANDLGINTLIIPYEKTSDYIWNIITTEKEHIYVVDGLCYRSPAGIGELISEGETKNISDLTVGFAGNNIKRISCLAERTCNEYDWPEKIQFYCNEELRDMPVKFKKGIIFEDLCFDF